MVGDDECDNGDDRNDRDCGESGFGRGGESSGSGEDEDEWGVFAGDEESRIAKLATCGGVGSVGGGRDSGEC